MIPKKATVDRPSFVTRNQTTITTVRNSTIDSPEKLYRRRSSGVSNIYFQFATNYEENENFIHTSYQ